MRLRWSFMFCLAVAFSAAVPTTLAVSAPDPQASKKAMRELVARISMPWNNARVRGLVPVFGVASAKEFKLCVRCQVFTFYFLLDLVRPRVLSLQSACCACHTLLFHTSPKQ